MELEKYINKTDILLYNGILNKIFKEFDTINHQKLSELLDKLRELHNHLDLIVHQKKVQSLFNTPYNNKLNLLSKKMDSEEAERIDNKEEWFNECVNINRMSLSNIYRQLKYKEKV